MIILSTSSEKSKVEKKELVPVEILSAPLNLKILTEVGIKGLSYIHVVSAHNCLDLLKSFLEQNANFNVNTQVSRYDREYGGYTALHFASANGHLEIVDHLLRHNADFTLKNNNNSTAIHLAHYNAHVEVVEQILLSHHRNFNICPVDLNNLSHFHLACAYSTPIIVRGFITCKSTDLNIRINDDSPSWPGCSPLHVAVKFENVRAVEILLAAGANSHAVATDGVTALHMACEVPFNSQIISSLLEKGADPNAVDEVRLSTPFRDYVLRSRLDLVYKFVSCGADVNKRLENGKTVLHVLFSRTDGDGLLVDDEDRFDLSSCGRDLLDLDFSDLSAQDWTGRTPLHYACLRHKVDEINFLVTNGADIEILDNDGRTPLNCCPNPQCPIRGSLVPYIDRLDRYKFHIGQQNRQLMENFAVPKPGKVEIENELEELDALRKSHLNKYVSLFDLLYKSPCELVSHVENPKFREVIMHEFFVDNYFKFGSVLLRQFRKGKARGAVLKPAEEALVRLSNRHLPDFCWEKILDFLDDKSMRNLIASNH